MKLVADEGVDRPIVEQLRRDGHEVLYIAESDSGISDDQVLDFANRHAATLITTDKDFGELIFRQNRLSQGILLLRLAGLPSAVKAQVVSSALRQHGPEMVGSFTVVSPAAVRVRHRT